MTFRSEGTRSDLRVYHRTPHNVKTGPLVSTRSKDVNTTQETKEFDRDVTETIWRTCDGTPRLQKGI